MARRTIEKCYPNAHGWLKLCHDDTEGDYYVKEPNWQDWGDEQSFTTLEEAKTYYEQQVKYWMNEPNWEAQARYDEEHGTINGYAPWQYNREY